MASPLLLPDAYVDGLDAAATAAAMVDATTMRRATEVNDLLLVGRWADLHASDPRLDPRPHPELPMPPGSDRLVDVGGEGTPQVRELCLHEAAVARGVHPLAMRSVTADVLDLRHRLPRVHAKLLDLACEPWLARKVAGMSRHLPAPVVHVVDAAVADAIGSLPSGKVLSLCEAKIIEADPARHAAKLEEARRRRLVTLTRIDDAGLRTVIARVTAGDAAWVDATLTRAVEILGSRPEHAATGRDELRSIAFGLLARPAELLQLLLWHDEGEDIDDEEAQPVSRALAIRENVLATLRSLDLTALRPTATVYVHLHSAVLDGIPGVARVEDLGPHTLAQLRDLLGHANVTLRPVIDLNDRVATDAYEHPEHVRERLHLARPGCRFPHATNRSRRVDADHPVPWDPGGPPGQTNSHDGQPLSRTAHRAKTHLRYTCTPQGPGAVLWRTPHGLHRWVDHTGTHDLADDEVADLASDDPITRMLTRICIRGRTGQL
ncbi:hypothetical protein ACFP3Q_00060 [Nocardioides sp. GCM10027113]|uniref:hypothetical protein n=1 Tax=unclassified Nocardioides TaxID=2615069 RepID=UPI00361D239E